MKQLKVFIALLLFLVTACAHTGPKARAVQFVVASDGVADEVADGWKDNALARVDFCRKEGYAEAADREACMGKFTTTGDVLEALLEVLVTAQLAVKIAVACESEIKPAVVECVEADWPALEANLMEAWDGIRPLYQEMKGTK